MGITPSDTEDESADSYDDKYSKDDDELMVETPDGTQMPQGSNGDNIPEEIPNISI